MQDKEMTCLLEQFKTGVMSLKSEKDFYENESDAPCCIFQLCQN